MLFFTLKYWQRYVIFHSEDAYCNDKEEGDDDRNGHVATTLHESPVGKTSYDARHGVYLLLEDDGHVVEQHVTYYTACLPSLVAASTEPEAFALLTSATLLPA